MYYNIVYLFIMQSVVSRLNLVATFNKEVLRGTYSTITGPSEV